MHKIQFFYLMHFLTLYCHSECTVKESTNHGLTCLLNIILKPLSFHHANCPRVKYVTTFYVFLQGENRLRWTWWGCRWSGMKKEWKVGRWAAEHEEEIGVKNGRKKSPNSPLGECVSPLGEDRTWTVQEAETTEWEGLCQAERGKGRTCSAEC